MSETILKLQEDQFIHEIHRKWWKEELGGGKCASAESGGSAGKAAELGVDNVGGVFVVLIAGVGAGFIISVCEFIWKARKNAKKDEVSNVLCKYL